MEDKITRNKRHYQWMKEHCDRISFVMPVGTKDRIKEAAGKLGITASEFVRQAIEEKLSK